MSQQTNNWDDIYIEYVNQGNRPNYDSILWSWLKNNYKTPKKIKNEEKSNAEGRGMENKEVPTNPI